MSASNNNEKVLSPFVSVIVPIYNVEKYLKSCLDSIVAQSYKNFEVILVDDGSPDNCGKICDAYAMKYDFIRVVHQKNQGVSAARNNGIKKSHGVYILPLDGDDTISPTYIERAVAIFESFPETKSKTFFASKKC